MSAVGTFAGDSGPSPSEAIGADLGRRVDAFRRAARRVRGQRDEEAVHDLRVAVRRIEAALALWKPLFRPRARRRATKRLRRLRRRLGPVRESEVVLASLGVVFASTPGLSPLRAILERAGRQVVQGRRRASRRAAKSRIRPLAALFDRARIDMGSRASAHPGFADDARSRASTLLARARERLGAALDRPDEESLHQARLAIKKWRYAGECLIAADLSDAARELATTRMLQKVLGDLHDDMLVAEYVHCERARLNPRVRDASAALLRRFTRSAGRARQAEVERLRSLAIREGWIALM